MKPTQKYLSQCLSRRTKTNAHFKLLPLALALAMSPLYAVPTGGQISVGAGAINQNGNTLTVDQSSQKLAINWQTFNVSKNESVIFQQPNAQAIALNRVQGLTPSVVDGVLKADGKVFLINPNGVLFGKTAQVNVGGLVASTLPLSDADFVSDRFQFKGGNGGLVSNEGHLTAAKGGYIALLGAQVNNQGVIEAQMGQVALASGKAVTLDFVGDKLFQVTVDQGAVNALIENKQLIQADGGSVWLTAKAADALAQAVVNNTGIIQAQTAENRNGSIFLLSDMQHGTVNVGGTLDASAPNGGDGGFVETSAAHVHLKDDLRINGESQFGKSGKWLLDPKDFTIAASGGDTTGTAIANQLDNGPPVGGIDVFISSAAGSNDGNGDIFVNDLITWHSNHALTLTATNNVYFNSNVTSDGLLGALTINSANYFVQNGAKITLSGSGANFTFNGTAYKVLNTNNTGTFANMINTLNTNVDLNKRYVLGTDFDAALNNIAPIGFVGPNNTAPKNFNGVLDGLGHTISNLKVDQAYNALGLFASIDTTGVVKNLGLLDAQINQTAGATAGALAGINLGTIDNVYAQGAGGSGNNTVQSNGPDIGGLVGDNRNIIRNSYANLKVIGTYDTGGLVGINSGAISNSHANSAVTGANETGGLIGGSISGTISNSYATGNVTGTFNVGGLIGLTIGAGQLIQNSYATGAVQATDPISRAGGLVGLATSGSQINNSFATGSTNANQYAGGLVGVMFSATVDQSYATGTANAASDAGGLVGETLSSSTISNSFATGSASGGANVGGLVGSNNASIINNSYSTVKVSGTGAGGLVGTTAGGTVNSSYWDIDLSGVATSKGGTGYNLTQMRSPANYIGWDLATIWYSQSGIYPVLRSLPNYVQVIANNKTRNFGGSNPSFDLRLFSLNGVPALNGSASAFSTAQQFSPVGSYLINASGNYSTATTINGLPYVFVYYPGILNIVSDTNSPYNSGNVLEESGKVDVCI